MFELRSRTCGKLKNVHKFEDMGHSDLVISLYLAQVSKHNCVKYEGSMINHIGRRGNYRKKLKIHSHFKNIGHIDLIFHVHIPEAYVHKYARYEVSVFH